jgi:hypothetical protein
MVQGSTFWVEKTRRIESKVYLTAEFAENAEKENF